MDPSANGPPGSGGSVFLGRYEVARRIAGGGMAEIYLGLNRGPSGIAEAVAIKCVRPELAEDRQFVKMLHQEAGLAIVLDHPNIVHVYEVGEHDGQVFLAMEYLLGETLGALQRAGEKVGVRVPCGVAARIVAEAARGLHYAHNLTDESGSPLMIVHRDVSPQNVFVTAEGITKLLDFGIAKAATALEQTQAGVVKGKYAYLSPEQARGEPVDHRSDVFSLGICAWEFITGERLFAADHSLASLHAVTSKPIPPVQRIRPDVPARVDAIIRRALLRKREDRWQTAGEMADALDEAAFAAGGATVADVAAFVRKLVGPTIERRRGVLNTLKRGSADVASRPPASHSGGDTDEPWAQHAATTVGELDELLADHGEPSPRGRGSTSYAQAGSALAPSARFETTPHVQIDAHRSSPADGAAAQGVGQRMTPSAGVSARMTPGAGVSARMTPGSGVPVRTPAGGAMPATGLPIVTPQAAGPPAGGLPASLAGSGVPLGGLPISQPIPTVEIAQEFDLPVPEITLGPMAGTAAGHTVGERPQHFEVTGPDAVAPAHPTDDPPTRAGRPKLARNLDELRAQLAGKIEASERKADVPALPAPDALPEPQAPLPSAPPPGRRATQRMAARSTPPPKQSGAVAALRTAIFVTIGIVIGAVVVFLTPKLFAPPNQGRLVVLVTPLDSDVKIDGRLIGRGSARLDPVVAGNHRVEVVGPDGSGVAQVLEVFAGKTTEVRIELVPAPAAQRAAQGQGGVAPPSPAPR